MDLKQFLKDNPLIKQAELARLMYGVDHATTKLANKLSGANKQRITPEDERLAIAALKILGANIEKLKALE
ncbi:hypothetical protein [Pedobacter nyackensis]|uniref:Uncharacterized protein n=1 Tax=Pedobacter nyackensis TaxID=475255 RepID=A0A1W1ZXW4_9SPHI|nr:hypothetical protein [Pedobacter nyackensis]SMC52981.1 hypothetical protein SAMN04488101_101118 [Pedobacter nyackensis]